MSLLSKTLTNVFCVFTFLITVNGSASVMYVQADKFSCSDGKDYDVLRHYMGGWGPGQWTFQGLCSAGTLTQKMYNGRIIPIRESHSDIARCRDEDTPEIRSCLKEFVRLNGNSGGELEAIVHGRKNNNLPEPPAYPVPRPEPGTFPAR